jgi:cell wall-associated NlpC family hydrolase
VRRADPRPPGRRPAFGLAAIVALAVLAVSAGCAARGARPRPFPTPGEPAAPAPPAAAGAETPAEPGAGAAPPALPSPPPAPALLHLLDTALAQRGAPYRPGGADPDGFDCSGFVTWVFGQHGFALPRTVQELYAAGARVDPAPPGAADLVFFATEGRGPSHVGIALGDGRFIHAPSRRGVVRVEALGSRYWAARYLGARRVWTTAVEPPASGRPDPRR